MRIQFNPANSVRYRARELGFLPACVFAGLAVYPLAIVLDYTAGTLDYSDKRYGNHSWVTS